MVEVQFEAYRGLITYNMLCYNNVYGEFTARFNAITGLMAVITIYGSIRAPGVISFYVYLLFPACALLCTLCLTVLNAQLCLLDLKSKRFMTLFRANVLHNTNKRRSEKLKQLAAMRSLRTRKSCFGYKTLKLPAAVVEQVINAVLLLLSF